MRSLLTILSLLIFGLVLQAQPAMANKALEFSNAKDFTQAKRDIDEAVKHESTRNQGWVWFIYGDIHKGIFNSDRPSDKVLDSNALDHAVAGYKKVRELESKGSNYYKRASFQLESLWTDLLNKGAIAHRDKKEEEAIRWFDMAKQVKPKDSVAYFYAGVAAQELKDIPVALQNFRKLSKMGYGNVSMYKSIIYYTQSFEKDTLTALDWLRLARRQFPSNDDFRRQEVNLLIQTNQYDKARSAAEEAVKFDAKNANLFFNLGYLYETANEDEMALENYRKAVEVDPNYFDANFNLAVYYYNRASDLFDAVNKMSVLEYNERGLDLEKEAQTNLKVALPYMESASRIRPEEAVIWNTLSTMYAKLEMWTKASDAETKYKSLSSL